MENKKSTLKERMQDEGFGTIKKGSKINDKPVIEVEYVDEKDGGVKKSFEDYL